LPIAALHVAESLSFQSIRTACAEKVAREPAERTDFSGMNASGRLPRLQNFMPALSMAQQRE
jgi:hypothetical protein